MGHVSKIKIKLKDKDEDSLKGNKDCKNILCAACVGHLLHHSSKKRNYFKHLRVVWYFVIFGGIYNKDFEVMTTFCKNVRGIVGFNLLLIKHILSESKAT